MQILFLLILAQWLKFAVLVNLVNGLTSYENKHILKKCLSQTGTASHKENGTMLIFPHAYYIVKRSISEENNNETNFETWDDWSDWSRCSVTCGAGRKVRWRHCLSDSCAKGLKRAQIKPCRLKKCSPNKILSWLGIKT